MILDISIYIISFIVLWIGAKMIVRSVDKLARHFKIKSFILSFVVLGLLTSSPEIFLGINSAIDNKPEISVGNLLGGILVLFLLIIPLLAVGNNGIKLKHDISFLKLFLSLVVVVLPSIFLIDNKITTLEGILCLASYFLIIFFIRDTGNSNAKISKPTHTHKNGFFDINIIFIIVGITLIFISSHFIVENTIAFSKLLNISPFLISFLLLSVGTDLPELSIALSSIIQRKSEVAFGDYLGAATASTFIIGLVSILVQKDIYVPTNLVTIGFIIFVSVLLFIFAHSRKEISRREGLILLGLFIAFGVYSVVSIS